MKGRIVRGRARCRTSRSFAVRKRGTCVVHLGPQPGTTSDTTMSRSPATYLFCLVLTVRSPSGWSVSSIWTRHPRSVAEWAAPFSCVCFHFCAAENRKEKGFHEVGQERHGRSSSPCVGVVGQHGAADGHLARRRPVQVIAERSGVTCEILELQTFGEVHDT